MGGIGSLINQSKNASSNASTQSTTDSGNDNSYGSHNADYSGSEHHDTNYDSHGVVTAGQGSTVNVTDQGAVASALETIKAVALGLADKVTKTGDAAGAGPASYSASAVSRIPTVAYVAGAVVLLALVAVGIIIVRRKK